MYFAISLLFSIEKQCGPKFEQIWILNTQGCFVPSLVEIGPVVLEKFINVFSLFHYYLPLEKGVVPYLNKSESFINVFLLFHYYLPLEKGVVPYLNKFESSPPKDALCQVLLILAQLFLRRRWKCEKFIDRHTDGWMTDNRRSEKLTWAFRPGELKTVLLLLYLVKSCNRKVALVQRVFPE